MELDKLQRDLKVSYNTKLDTIQERVSDVVKHVADEWSIDANRLTIHEIKTLSSTILDIETQTLHDEVESLLAQKEQIERKLERKFQSLQEAKYQIFDAMEAQLSSDDAEALAKLHQVKLQTIDLFDLLSEIVESAIITALEKDKDSEIEDSIHEVIKDITYEAIKEGSLNTIRIRKILSTILQAAIDIAEASPVKAKDILEPTLKGMRSGLIHSITRFKQRLVFIPIEAKHILIEDYDTIIEDLNQTDSLFSQVVQTQADESSQTIKDTLVKINKDMRYDLEELLRISKETADVMRDRFSLIARKAVNKADSALKSPTAAEAKRMGKQALGIAKTALDSALKSAKDAMDKKA
ncbi:DUF6781 family protein [Sulfurimonas sp.]